MGLSFGEIVVLAVLALVVIGPKDLPKLLRSVGRMVGQAKRAISDVKRETGLDEILRGDFRDLERLADHIEELGVEKPTPRPVLINGQTPGFRTREYPLIGADSMNLLPEDSDVYVQEPSYAPTVLGTLAAVEPASSGRESRGVEKAAS